MTLATFFYDGRLDTAAAFLAHALASRRIIEELSDGVGIGTGIVRRNHHPAFAVTNERSTGRKVAQDGRHSQRHELE